MKKQFAVFGLGSFGHSVALTLERLGCDVVVVDKSQEKIQEISDCVSYAMRADLTDPEVLKSLGARNLDGAVVALSESLEASIMAIIASKELGIPYVLVKAVDELQGTIFKKIGADAIVYPERDMGSRVAKNLISSEFADWIELSDDFSLVETKIPQSWVGKSLAELRVRENYDVNVVGVIAEKHIDVNVDPTLPLPDKCIIILIGANDVLEKFQKSSRK